MSANARREAAAAPEASASAQPNRLEAGGRIDRSRPLAFTFDGRSYTGCAGDTLASALLANGVRLVGRSFKYHRPRGIYTAGPEEPNALVSVRRGDRAEPNTRATMQELFDGLDATSQNRWPSLAFDLRGIHQSFARFMPAGFYYKTFMWPPAWWLRYEHAIRKAAGLGIAPTEADPDAYAFEYAHCDVLVVGSGPAGLAAALAAARAGARVVLTDERAELGGTALWDASAGDRPGLAAWAARIVEELRITPNVRLLTRSTAFGAYDHGLVGIVERITDHVAAPADHQPRQRLIHLRTGAVVLASGAIERPLVFADNDKPGVMLASALRAYIHRYAVMPGRRVAIFTNNDDAYNSALAAKRAGAKAVTLVDSRADVASELAARLRAAGVEHHLQSFIAEVHGATVEAVTVKRADGSRVARIDCDIVGTSGGWNPTIHLYSQAGGALRFDDAHATFVPAASRPPFIVAGSANGTFGTREAIAEGEAAGIEAARRCGFTTPDGSGVARVATSMRAADTVIAAPLAATEARDADVPRPSSGSASDAQNVTPALVPPPDVAASEPCACSAFWQAPAAHSRGKRFVDIQDDVTVEDIELAHRENYRSVEHLKRYTTLGMGTDQGKTSNVNGLAILAALRNEPITAVGTTTFRPPYTPVAFGALAGPETGRHGTPVRRTALHGWHVRRGAMLTTVGHWLRPRVYQQDGESFDAAWRRESLAVRNGVGLVDVGTLGKIDVQGPDALAFLQRVYCNNFANLQVGRLRYGLMLREDGIVFDDGTVARLAEDRFIVSTTTVNAAKVQSQLEFLLQVAWPELRCHAVSVTEQFAQFALAGPRSRDVLARLLPQCDVSDAALPHLGVLQTTLDGTPVIVYRMSYSGERAYEIAVGADCGEALWTRILECGAAAGLTPYGTEAMGVLRIEKGHVTGNELDGRTTAADVGMGRLVRRSGGFIGAALVVRAALHDASRAALVGLVPVDGRSAIRAGSQLVASEAAARAAAALCGGGSHQRPPEDDAHLPRKLGVVTSATPSAFLGHPIALALLENGAARHGEELVAASPLSNEYVGVKVVPPVFVDPANERLKG